VEHATIGDDMLRGGTGGAAIYGIIDQMLWQEPGAKDNGIGAFLMVMGTPTAICFSDLYVEGGLNWKGPIRGRSNDVLGLGVAYLHLDPGYQQFATNALSAAGEIPNVKSSETVIEATYLYEVTPWWVLQPDIQMVINPFAGLPSPVNDRSLSNALATGLRMTVKF
jgi:porin